MGRESAWRVLSCVLLLLGCVVSVLGDDSDMLLGKIHTIVSVECSAYFSFQILTLAFTHKHVGQTGPITRIMACSPEGLQKFSQEDMDMMNTHVTPRYHYDPETGDSYVPYNRPGGILHWLENAKPREEWFFMVDPDVIFRHPVTPESMYVKEGWARATRYSYLKGTRNELAHTHIPEVKPRNDKHGGAPGRRADEAGSFFYMRIKDMKRVAPLYMNYTKAVRADPEAWNLAGDAYAKEGKPVWISEMYGWVFGMAKADVWHILDPILQVYPGYDVKASPTLVHYGLNHKVGKYTFDKHHHLSFNYTKCPPWNMHPDRKKEEDAGLMPHPPFPHEVSEEDVGKRYGLMLTIEVVNTINQALCERHRKMCAASEELLRECEIADNIQMALDWEYEVLDRTVCRDSHPATCDVNKRKGDCGEDFSYMGWHCRESCGLCPNRTQNEDESRLQGGLERTSLRANYVHGNWDSRCKKLRIEEVLENVECMKWAEQYGLKAKTVHGAWDVADGGNGLPILLLTAFAFMLLAYIASPWRKCKQRSHKA